MKRPSREPDFVYKVWEFWIEEGIQCGSYDRVYNIAIVGDRIHWQSLDGKWFQYADGDEISRVYAEWVVESVLLS